MKNKISAILIVIFVLCSAFAMHKFYTAIYQIEFQPEKKEVQITMRVFVDDINDALEKKFHKKCFINTNKETENDTELLKRYILEKFKITLDGKEKTLIFHQKEIENNILICYFKIKDISKIKTMQIENTILTELHSEQQNIIQTQFNGKKQSLLFTDEIIKGVIK